MFGIEHKINDSGLYLLSDILEEQLQLLEYSITKIPKKNELQLEQAIAKLAYLSSELQKFEDEIENQRKEKFQFSIEEIYAMYGQFERKYISIEFHKYSKSSKQFGRNISGIIVYSKTERESLEEFIHKDSVPRTNGLIKLESSNENLTTEQKAKLLQEGFTSGDIYEVLTSNYPVNKAFGQIGTKEIPNTIELKMNPTGFDVNRSNRWLLSQKIKNRHALTENDWAKFCGLSFYLEPQSIEIDIIKQHGLNKDNSKKYLARFYELEAKLFDKNISTEEIQEFNVFLIERKASRVKQISQEIKRSTNKPLEKFKDEHFEIFKSLERSRIEFEDETFAYFNIAIPIFWDYPGFLHIYLRHCDELAIEGHFENKTKFQYTYKDIRRILKIAIDNLLPQINERLSQGKDFRIHGDKSLYFNGNHYSLHILNNGRIAAFHPLENPK